VVAGGAVPPITQALLPTAVTTTLVDVATGDGHGQYKWNFTLDNSAVQFLSQGQTLSLTYQTTVTDSSPFAPLSHASASQFVTVTITGTNDAPIVLNTTAFGLLHEDGTTTADGFALFTDVDLSDTHVAGATLGTVSWSGGIVPGDLAFDLFGAMSTSITDSTGIGSGHADWHFSVDNNKLQFLAANETVTAHYQINVIDAFLASSVQDVTINIVGANDAPVITGPATAERTITEGNGTTTFEFADSIPFSDADFTDHHTVTASFNAGLSNVGSPLGVFTLNFDPIHGDTTNGTGGLAQWVYDIDDALVQYLGANDQRVEVFDVVIDDGHGGTATETVTITINGADDSLSEHAVAWSGGLLV
jgi:VCBS repeat-containing protein